MTENAVQNAPLSGKTVAFLATDGVEQVELTSPWEAVIAAGATPVLVSPKSGTITAMKSDWEHGESFEVNTTVKDAKAEDFHGLVMPGGTLNADALRIDTDAQAFVRAFFEQHKPVAAICHAPWTLIEAGVVDGRHDAGGHATASIVEHQVCGQVFSRQMLQEPAVSAARGQDPEDAGSDLAPVALDGAALANGPRRTLGGRPGCPDRHDAGRVSGTGQGDLGGLQPI